MPPSLFFIRHTTHALHITQVRALLLTIRRRSAHILPRALGPELARFRRMRPAFYVLGEEDEAAVAVQSLETFLPRWGEREEVVALARALPQRQRQAGKGDDK